MIGRYAIAVMLALGIVLANEWLISEWDLYEPETSISSLPADVSPAARRAAIVRHNGEFAAAMDAGRLRERAHRLIVLFVAMSAGGFIARRWFAVAATLLVATMTLAMIDLMSRLQDGFAAFVVESTLPSAATWPTTAEFVGHSALQLLVALTGALVGEWLRARRRGDGDPPVSRPEAAPTSGFTVAVTEDVGAASSPRRSRR